MNRYQLALALFEACFGVVAFGDDHVEARHAALDVRLFAKRERRGEGWWIRTIAPAHLGTVDMHAVLDPRAVISLLTSTYSAPAGRRRAGDR